MRVKLVTVNTVLNFFFLSLGVIYDMNHIGKGTTLALSTVFKFGHVYEWPQIRFITWVGRKIK